MSSCWLVITYPYAPQIRTSLKSPYHSRLHLQCLGKCLVHNTNTGSTCKKKESSCARWRMRKSLSCVRLCDPMHYTIHGLLPGQNTGLGSRSLLQGIFPTQGSNPGFPHCRRILYQLSLQYSGLANSMDCIVHGLQSWTQLIHFHFQMKNSEGSALTPVQAWPHIWSL